MKKVIINNVCVDFCDDEAAKAGDTMPMRATIPFLLGFPDTSDSDREALNRLRHAGVKHVPVYKSEAVAAGIEWEEVS